MKANAANGGEIMLTAPRSSIRFRTMARARAIQRRVPPHKDEKPHNTHAAGLFGDFVLFAHIPFIMRLGPLSLEGDQQSVDNG